MDNEDDRHYHKMAYVEAHKKSKWVSFFLTLLFGPLGLLYCRAWVAAVILLALAVGTLSTIVVPIACWLIAMYMGFNGVEKHNTRLLATANLMAGR